MILIHGKALRLQAKLYFIVTMHTDFQLSIGVAENKKVTKMRFSCLGFHQSMQAVEL